MIVLRQIALLLCVICYFLSIEARPDSAGHVPLPGHGISYGGIPYGSMSGNVAEYFKQRPSIGRGENLRGADEYTPLEQYL